MFRHERPQKGRYRQFHQIGVEALGFGGPDIDAELILMCQRLWDDLGLEGVRLELNSLGQAEERQEHRSALIRHFESHAGLLDVDAQRRLQSNPLRILDSKNPAMQELIESAPKLLDYLGADSGIPYRINPRLVRGLDYYNLTVFEWVTDSLGAQGTVCAGGRYDGLFAQLGGKPQPACGFAMGIERLLMLWQAAGAKAIGQAVDIYVVHQGEQAQRFAFRVAEGMRDNGYGVQLHCGGGSFKSQMKRADSSGATLALIIGEDEAAASEVTIKPLREAAEQRRVAYDQLAEAIGELLFEWDENNGGI
jgi:histidyl-tRNA synthetase